MNPQATFITVSPTPTTRATINNYARQNPATYLLPFLMFCLAIYAMCCGMRRQARRYRDSEAQRRYEVAWHEARVKKAKVVG